MIYFAQVGNQGPIKIGTTIDLRTRIGDHASHYGTTITVLGVCVGGREKEVEIHAIFEEFRIDKRRTRKQELFTFGDPIREYIKKHCRKPDLLDYIHEEFEKHYAPNALTATKLPRNLMGRARHLANERGISVYHYLVSILTDPISDDWEAHMNRPRDPAYLRYIASMESKAAAAPKKKPPAAPLPPELLHRLTKRKKPPDPPPKPKA